MTHLASPREDARTGAFALLWVMLRQVLALILNPAQAAEAGARMAELEMEAARSLVAHALAHDPALAGLSLDDVEIVALYTASGEFAPDVRLKPHVMAARGAAHRAFLLQLRHVRLVRETLARIATLRGLRGRLRRPSGVSLVHRRRTALRACARTPDRAAPRVLIPP